MGFPCFLIHVETTIARKMDGAGPFPARAETSNFDFCQEP